MDASTTEKIAPSENDLHMVRGLPFSTWFKKETIEEICDFIPADGDVIIATYPKTGTTWMQYIVHQILTQGKSFPSFDDLLMKVVPFLEMSGVSAVEAMTTRPRVYKHHLPYSIVQKNPKAKVIYIYRKPEDTLVSFYHFNKNMNVLTTFDEFFENFVTGNISYGRYFEHVISYLEYKNEENMLLVSYEKLLVHRKDEILRIAKFLGEEYYNILANEESILDQIVEHTSFDYMKKNLILNMPSDPKKAFEKDNSAAMDGPKVQITFFRKGVSGDGKKALSESQLQRINDLSKELMEGTDILFEWLQE